MRRASRIGNRGQAGESSIAHGNIVDCARNNVVVKSCTLTELKMLLDNEVRII